jgi:hypothetical protein
MQILETLALIGLMNSLKSSLKPNQIVNIPIMNTNSGNLLNFYFLFFDFTYFFL